MGSVKLRLITQSYVYTDIRLAHVQQVIKFTIERHITFWKVKYSFFSVGYNIIQRNILGIVWLFILDLQSIFPSFLDYCLFLLFIFYRFQFHVVISFFFFFCRWIGIFKILNGTFSDSVMRVWTSYGIFTKTSLLRPSFLRTGDPIRRYEVHRYDVTRSVLQFFHSLPFSTRHVNWNLIRSGYFTCLSPTEVGSVNLTLTF